ncbi:MAG: zinc ribbon domain-containing protein [Firmicutes bacterium]|nr:zinc ribbon domain-containing protein [Bacillota bacterium]
MPLIEFECQLCNNRFETLVRTGDEVRCPSCNSSELRRRVSRFSARSGSSGVSRPIGGGACSTCSGGSCSTCS